MLYSDVVSDGGMDPRNAEQEVKYVWIVGSKTWSQVCATEEAAHRFIAQIGMNTPSLYPTVTKTWLYE